MEKQFLILQWGKKRSIIVCLKNNKINIVSNHHLMFLDKKGLVV